MRSLTNLELKDIVAGIRPVVKKASHLTAVKSTTPSAIDLFGDGRVGALAGGPPGSVGTGGTTAIPIGSSTSGALLSAKLMTYGSGY